MALAGALLTGAGMTLALAQPSAAAPNCNVPVPPPACGSEEPPPPPPPAYVPVLAFDGARQTTSGSAVQVWGWTADDDAPTTPLTVHVSIDGTTVRTLTANQHRPDVAVVYPRFGPAHGFELELPVTGGQHNICVTAVSIGGGSNKTSCRQMDAIVEFQASNVSYDLSRGQLTSTALDQLDRVTHRNDTTLQQSTEINGSRTITNVQGWSDSTSVRISTGATIKTGIPIFAEGHITLSADYQTTYTSNGQTSESRTVGWRQNVIVPPRSIVEATVLVTRLTVSVPYTLTGKAVYASGAMIDGTVTGWFTGVSGDDIQVNLKQYNLDGSPAAQPVPQEKATIIKGA